MLFWRSLIPSLKICLIFQDFERYIGVTKHRHINEKASFIMIFYNYVWSICPVCPVSMNNEIS